MRPYSRALRIHRRADNSIPPPLRRFNPIQSKREKYEERGQRQTQIQARRRQKVQAAPPPEVALLDPELEDEAHDAPGEVIERAGGRDGAGPAEEERRDEISYGGFWVLLDGEVDDDWGDCAEDEEDEEAGVDLAWGEHSAWANEAPDNRGWKIMSMVNSGAEGHSYQNRILFHLGM